jgi:hypothetical protein
MSISIPLPKERTNGYRQIQRAKTNVEEHPGDIEATG